MRKSAFLVLAAGLTATLAASAAAADPCHLIPDQGPTPADVRPGASFGGTVVYVGDGDSLCIALGSGPDRWAEVRLADWFAPELAEPGGAQAKATLVRAASGRRATCRAEGRSYDRVIATCRIGGRSIADLMRDAGAIEGGRGRRR